MSQMKSATSDWVRKLAGRSGGGAGAAVAVEDENASERPGGFEFVRSYEQHTAGLLASEDDPQRALELAIGGSTPEDFEAIGRLQKQLLIAHGLTPESALVEVGCGSGRLAVQLNDWLRGSYLGTDVVQALLDRARAIAPAPNLQFARVTGLTIPSASGSADYVCAFSVFTHLLHEESYVYMEDCRRVLKPGGHLVFSFLEFRVPSHWSVLEANVAAVGSGAVLNQFMSVDAIEAWSEHLDLELVGLFRGDGRFIPLPEPVTLNGIEFTDAGSFGQSVAVLRRPLDR